MVVAFKIPVAPCSFCGHFESRGSVILYKGRALCSVHSQLKGKDRTGMTENSLVLKSYLRESSSLGRSQDWAGELYLGRKQKAAFVLTRVKPGVVANICNHSNPLTGWAGTFWGLWPFIGSSRQETPPQNRRKGWNNTQDYPCPAHAHHGTHDHIQSNSPGPWYISISTLCPLRFLFGFVFLNQISLSREETI